MNWKIQILLVVTTGVSSFPIHNSTLVTDSKHLFKPIIIPNITGFFEPPHPAKTAGSVRAKDPDPQRSSHPQKVLQESTVLSESFSDEESKVSENALKFSSRYSTEEKDLKNVGKTGQTNDSATEVPYISAGKDSEPGKDEPQGGEEHRTFSDRSDDFDSSEEEEKDVRSYIDSNEPDESEVAPTTNEPIQDLPRPTSFQSNQYPDENLKNYEITSTLSEEEAAEEEKDGSEEEEEKRSADDYYNSGSKNYHSVQTPLSNIQYRGPHSFREDFDSKKVRTRLLSPIRRPSTRHKWPYSKLQKVELEGTNDISESDESNLEEGIRKELKGKSKTLGLELAVEKDEKRFDEKEKYNFVKERDRERQKLKSLTVEEEKDHGSLPFQILKQYQVDEEPRYQAPKKATPKFSHDGRKAVTTTSRNIFLDKPKENPKLDIPQELSPVFHAHQFLGPVVFNPNGGQEKAKATNPRVKNFKKEPIRNTLAKGLLDREKLDRDNLTNERIHKSIYGTGSANHDTLSFNHLEESEEIYNSILANIQSVFGLKTSKPGVADSRSSGPDESRHLTWSLPLKKPAQVN